MAAKRSTKGVLNNAEAQKTPASNLSTNYVKRNHSEAPAWLKVLMWILQLLVFVAALLVIYILYEVVYKGNADYDPVRSGLEHVNRFWATLTAPAPHMFTKEELAKYDGTDPSLPVLLAFKGRVYDVSRKRHIYAKGGDYGFFSGKDASRAFATGCFKPECLIDDLTGLDEKEMQEIDRWVAFYDKEYIYVGDLKKE